jgi:hypothetical protein
MTDRPQIANAPGLTWNRRAYGWEARWQARTDLVKRGYAPKSVRVWTGAELGEADVLHIQDRCNTLQTEMLVWGRGGVQEIAKFDGTLGSLIRCYQTDEVSEFHKIRYRTRLNYGRNLKRIADAHGELQLGDIRFRDLKAWHQAWSADGKLEMGHSMMTQVRILIGFGATVLENDECARISGVLHAMKFSKAGPRTNALSAEQATAIRELAHRKGMHSIALAQAFQFDCLMRQRDVIGEYVPGNEPGTSDVLSGNSKWLRGLRWSEIDQNWIMRHTTSKKLKPLVIDLRMCPMVAEELERLPSIPIGGPVIVNEATGAPYRDAQFRLSWRAIATELGIPKDVRNMDSRAGGITEATDAGAPIEHVRHAATHSDVKTTQRYSRGGEEKITNVLKMRAEHRNKGGTK